MIAARLIAARGYEAAHGRRPAPVMASTLRTLLTAVATVSCVVASSLAQVTTWSPPEPELESLDWIRLNSGEWLHGEITGLRDKAFTFDSEELDELSLDWDDVAELRSPRILTYGFEDKLTATGAASLKNGVLKIRDAEGNVQEFARRDLLGIIEGELREINFWSAKANLGLVARAGNTDQTDLNAVANLRRVTTRSRVNFDYNGNFGKLGAEQNINNHRGTGKWDILLAHGFFVVPVQAEVSADKFTNIELRTTVAAAAGYFLIRTSDLEWELQFGGGYQKTDFISVEPGEAKRQETGSLIPSMRIEADVTSDLELSFDYNAQVGVPDPREAFHHLLTQLEMDFWRYFDLVFSVNWDRVESPRPNEDGTIPKRDDVRTTFGFGVDL